MNIWTTYQKHDGLIWGDSGGKKNQSGYNPGYKILQFSDILSYMSEGRDDTLISIVILFCTGIGNKRKKCLIWRCLIICSAEDRFITVWRILPSIRIPILKWYLFNINYITVFLECLKLIGQRVFFFIYIYI